MSLIDEDLMPLAAAIRSLPGRPSLSTGFRFVSRGCRGVRLETVLVGGRRFTSRQALRRFVEATTAAAAGRSVIAAAPLAPPPSARAAAPPQRTHVQRDLDQAGL